MNAAVAYYVVHHQLDDADLRPRRKARRRVLATLFSIFS
jgi:hypothetical protein